MNVIFTWFVSTDVAQGFITTWCSKFVDKESFASSNYLLHNTGALIDVGILTSSICSVVRDWNRHERLLNWSRISLSFITSQMSLIPNELRSLNVFSSSLCADEDDHLIPTINFVIPKMHTIFQARTRLSSTSYAGMHRCNYICNENFKRFDL